ncbi:MAG: haloacid dehalogenase-like hydrolase [Candidatus Omnitrophica bacterium]|nr:haloacid dehalogenase-like hydrolase [Candidatus Omnitrophota bacterium]
MKTLLLFDIDGTLLLTGGAGKIAFERAFLECFGVADSWGGTLPDGRTDPLIFDEIARRVLGRGLTSPEHDRLCAKYLAYFPPALEEADRFRLMPGALPLVRLLSTLPNVLLGLATGNFKSAAFEKIRHGGFEGFFRFGGYACDSADRDQIVRTAVTRGMLSAREAGDIPGDIWVIGDTPFDIRSGRAAGGRTIGVATGRYTLQELAAESPDGLLIDLSDPTPFLDLIGPPDGGQSPKRG